MLSRAAQVMNQNDGETTKAFYAQVSKLGPRGELAVALFRAQKRSSRAKDYRRGKYRAAAYDVKQWSLNEVCRILAGKQELREIRYGWKQDPNTVFGSEPSWVLYVDLPTHGQVSFHSPTRGNGPLYDSDWDGVSGIVASRIIAFCDEVIWESAAATTT